MSRIDTHHHAMPAFYRESLLKAGIGEAGGRYRSGALMRGQRRACCQDRMRSASSGPESSWMK